MPFHQFEAFTPMLISLVILLLLFLICREVVCWYWKINARIELLTEIRDLLKKQAE